jgi:hypothetical protein
MNRFVIQQHRTRDAVHYDLMLDRGDGGRLATWSLAAMPPAAGASCPAKRLADHRRVYLTYEGPLSGDRGEVHIAAAGTWALEADAPDRLVLRLESAACRGRFELRRDPAGGPEAWRLTALPDR